MPPRRIAIPAGIVLTVAAGVFITAAFGGGYGRLLARSKVSTDSEGGTGYIDFTRLPAGPHVYTLVFDGPAGKLYANGYIGCVNGRSIYIRQVVTQRPYVRSFQAPTGSGSCRANADANIARVPGRPTSAATIRLYGR